MQATFLDSDFEQWQRESDERWQKNVAEIRARLTDMEDRLTEWENGRDQKIERASV